MRFIKVIFLSTLFTGLVATANAQVPTMADAQKAYVASNWKEAAAAFEKVCPGEPKETQVSCHLWGILAMSQIGDAKNFKKAGNKLDSLINATNPQHANYADLVMTRAQFMLYLGKYDKAAEELIHAIETSQESHNLVLQKVCAAILSRTKSQDLSERCDRLKLPKEPTAVSSSEPLPQSSAAESTMTQPAAQATVVASSASDPAQKEPEIAKPTEITPADTLKKDSSPKTAEEYWVLQLGAFGMKSNATLLVANLAKQKIQSTITEIPRGEKVLFIVQTGHFATKEAASDYGEKTLTPLKVEFQPIFKK